MPNHYLDYNATAPLCPVAREMWHQATQQYPGNPSSSHREGKKAAVALQSARALMAARLNCDPQQLRWTSGSTESLNAAVYSLAKANQSTWISPWEHPAVRSALSHWSAAPIWTLPLQPNGVLDLDQLRNALQTHPSRPALIAISAASNLTGILQPIQAIQTLCRSLNLPLLCDATQAIGRIPWEALHNIDYVVGSFHKVGGPKGVGFLKGPPFSNPLTPGHQESGQRAGTENLPAILSAMATLDWLDQQPMDPTPKLQFEANLPTGSTVAGQTAERLFNTTFIGLPPRNGSWAAYLDQAGYTIGTGSACIQNNPAQPFDLPLQPWPYKGAQCIRISSGWNTAPTTWQQLGEAIQIGLQ